MVETKQNTITCQNKHSKPTHDLEPAQHLKRNIDHLFAWKIIATASKNTHTRKDLEALFIAQYRPTFNDKV